MGKSYGKRMLKAAKKKLSEQKHARKMKAVQDKPDLTRVITKRDISKIDNPNWNDKVRVQYIDPIPRRRSKKIHWSFRSVAKRLKGHPKSIPHGPPPNKLQTNFSKTQ